MAAQDNPFFIQPANPLQALMTGVQGYDRAAKSAKEADLLAARQEAMGLLQGGGDPKQIYARLLGDPQTLNAVSSIYNNEADRTWRREEATRSQRNADRSFGLQQSQHNLAVRSAEEAARGYDIREVDDGQGGKRLVAIHKQTRQAQEIPIGGQSQEGPTNPFAQPGKPPTESQANAGLYAGRMIQAEQILRDPKIVSAATSVPEQVAGEVGNRAPFGLARGAMSEEFQKYDQAKRNFINAVLRRESGAVISPEEFKNADKQYFPAPGDTKETLDQKSRNRAEAIRGIGAAAGNSFSPTHIFNEQGEMVPNPRGRRSSAGGPTTVPPPAAVAALRENPRLKTAFDAKYGKGAADRALGAAP